MKHFFGFYVFIGLIFSCNTIEKNDNQVISFTFIDINGKSEIPDKKLITTWQAFVNAVKTDNFKLLKSLCLDTIYCENCLTNTSAEDSIYTNVMLGDTSGTFYEKSHNRRYLSFQEFLKNDYGISFNSNLILRISDSTRVSGHYDDTNRDILTKQYNVDSQKINNPKIAEFFITTTDRTEDFEGGATALAFVETINGYKFCGYSTIL